MSNIKVIETVKEVRELSREEREARLEEVAEKSKLPRFHFDNFLDLEDEVIAKELKKSKPEITSLLVRKLLLYNSIIPIIPEHRSPLKSTEDVFKFYNVPTLRAFGGKTTTKPKMKQPKTTKQPKTKQPKPIKTTKQSEKQPETKQGETTKQVDDALIPEAILSVEEVAKTVDVPKEGRSFAISVQVKGVKDFILLDDLNARQSCDIPGLVYRTSENETVMIKGVLIDPRRPLRSYPLDNYIWSMNMFSEMVSGVYDSEYMHNTVFSPIRSTEDNSNYVTVLKRLPHFKEVEFDGKPYYYYLFNDEKQTREICESLVEYMNYIETIWASSYVNNVITRAFHNADRLEDFTAAKTQSPKFTELFRLMVIMMTRFHELSSNITPTKTEDYHPSKDLVDFVKRIEPFMSRVPGFNSELGLISDFWSSDLLTLLEKYQLGQPAFRQDIQDFMVDKKKRLFDLAQSQKLEQTLFDIKFNEMQHRWIYIHKFGEDRFEKLYEGKSKTESILPLMNPKERSIVETEVRKINKYAEMVEKNTCPHVGIESRFRIEETADQKLKLYEDLKKYLPVKERSLSRRQTPLDFIQCINCKFNTICPHVRDEMELKKQKTNDDEIRNFIFKYAGDTELYDAYYCRICGEPITHNEEMEGLATFVAGQPVEFHNVEDALRDDIWKEASHIVRNFVEFKGIKTNKFINKFVSTLVAGIYSFIYSIEKKLSRVKTSSREEIDRKKKLFTVIYLMAFLIKVINENPTTLKFTSGKAKTDKDRMKIKSKFTKTPVPKLMAQALVIINGSQNTLITQIEGMSEVVVRTVLFKSYKWIDKFRKKSTLPVIKEPEIITTLLLDPIYNYIIQAHIFSRLNTIGSKVKSKEFAKIKESFVDPKNSLGRTIAQMEKSEYVFEDVKPVQFRGFDFNTFDKFVETGETNNPDKLYEGYWIRNFLHVFSYLHSRIYLHPFWSVQPTTDSSTNKNEHIKTVVSKEYRDYLKQYEELKKAEDRYYDYLRLLKARVYKRLPYEQGSQYIEPENLDDFLPYIYGDQFNSSFSFKSLGVDPPSKKSGYFHQHKWDFISYKTDGSRRVFHKRDTKKLEQESKSKTVWEADDVICSICFYAQSQISKVIKDPVQIIEKDQLMTSFYNFYAVKCPLPTAAQIHAGDALHQFKKSDPPECSNCGYKREFREDKNQQYFTKYLTKFKKEIEEIEEPLTIVISSKDVTPEVPKSIKTPNIGDDIKKWKFNPNIITEFTNATYDIIKQMKLKKNQYYNIWINLGLTEGVDFDDVMNGKESLHLNITSDPELARLREQYVSAYVQKFIIDYNTLRNHKNIAVLSPNMKELVAKTGLAKVESKLPNFAATYHIQREQLRRRFYKEDDVYQRANFHLEFLCKALLKLLKAARKEVTPFLEYFIKEIIDAENFHSEPKESRKAKLLATQDQGTYENIMEQDEAVSDMTDALVPEEQESPYSMEGMDYDGHNDEGALH